MMRLALACSMLAGAACGSTPKSTTTTTTTTTNTEPAAEPTPRRMTAAEIDARLADGRLHLVEG